MFTSVPKAELHLHLEGSLEPELLFKLAQRNAVAIPFESVEQLRRAYSFSNLQQFLDLYYQGMQVLRTEQDFFDLTCAYLARSHADGVDHVEVFFDPQAHTARGVAFDAVIGGIVSGLEFGQREWGVSWRLIMSFLRHLPERDGFATLAQAEPWLDKVCAVGLDSSELGHPPRNFSSLFRECRQLGLKLCMHAGEEGPPDYVRQALFEIGVDRIDHGNRAMEDPDLIAHLAREQITLTVCPLSNLSLGVIDEMASSPLRAMLDAGLRATVNSDDPAYFGGYMQANLNAVAFGLELDNRHLSTLVENSYKGSFLPADEVERRIARVREVTRTFG